MSEPVRCDNTGSGSNQTRPKETSVAEHYPTIVPIPPHARFPDLTKFPPFGRLDVLGYVGRAGMHRLWLCQCACGTVKVFRANNLLSGHTNSCGCLRREVTVARFTRHGMKRSLTYRSWACMRQRCLNPEHEHHAAWGGRGIRPCSRWDSFANFLADLGPRPSKRHSIDRIHNDRGYWCGKPECPECGPLGRKPNCRWATQFEQSRNTRRNKTLTLGDETHCASAWAEILGISASVIVVRKRRGWSDERTLTTPVRKCNRG